MIALYESINSELPVSKPSVIYNLKEELADDL